MTACVINMLDNMDICSNWMQHGIRDSSEVQHSNSWVLLDDGSNTVIRAAE